jgi:hypothetical protein
MSTYDIDDKFSAEPREIVRANHGMNWAGLPQSDFICPGLVNQRISQNGVVLQSPVHMSDEPRERKALPRRSETHLTEKSERSIRIESAATEVSVRPCMQVKLAMTMGGSEIDTCRGESIHMVRSTHWINCVDDLLSRGQAFLYEGKESTSLLISIAAKAQTCARAPSSAPHSCGCGPGRVGRSATALAIVGALRIRVVTSTTSLISVSESPVSIDHDRPGSPVNKMSTNLRPERTKNARKVTYAARGPGEDAWAVHRCTGRSLRRMGMRGHLFAVHDNTRSSGICP